MRRFTVWWCLSLLACPPVGTQKPTKEAVSTFAEDGFVIGSFSASRIDNAGLGLFDPRTGQASAEGRLSSGLIAISPDGRHVASLLGGEFTKIEYLEIVRDAEGRPAWRFIRDFVVPRVHHLGFNSRGDRIVADTAWIDPETGATARLCEGSEQSVSGRLIDSPDGRHFVVGCIDGVELFEDFTRVGRMLAPARHQRFSLDGQWLIADDVTMAMPVFHVPSRTARANITDPDPLRFMGALAPYGEARDLVSAYTPSGASPRLLWSDDLLAMGGIKGGVQEYVTTTIVGPTGVPEVSRTCSGATLDAPFLPTRTVTAARSFTSFTRATTDGVTFEDERALPPGADAAWWRTLGQLPDGRLLIDWHYTKNDLGCTMTPVARHWRITDGATSLRVPFESLQACAKGSTANEQARERRDWLGRTLDVEFPLPDAAMCVHIAPPTMVTGVIGGRAIELHEVGTLFSLDGRRTLSDDGGEFCFYDVQKGGTRKCLTGSLDVLGFGGFGVEGAMASAEAKIFAVSQRQATPGTEVHVFGANFGASGTLKVGDSIAEVVSWSSGHIVFRVTESLPAAGRITVAGMPLDTRPFWLRRTALWASPLAGVPLLAPRAYDFGLGTIDADAATLQGRSIVTSTRTQPITLPLLPASSPSQRHFFSNQADGEGLLLVDGDFQRHEYITRGPGRDPSLTWNLFEQTQPLMDAPSGASFGLTLVGQPVIEGRVVASEADGGIWTLSHPVLRPSSSDWAAPRSDATSDLDGGLTVYVRDNVISYAFVNRLVPGPVFPTFDPSQSGAMVIGFVHPPMWLDGAELFAGMQDAMMVSQRRPMLRVTQGGNTETFTWDAGAQFVAAMPMREGARTGLWALRVASTGFGAGTMDLLQPDGGREADVAPFPVDPQTLPPFTVNDTLRDVPWVSVGTRIVMLAPSTGHLFALDTEQANPAWLDFTPGGSVRAAFFERETETLWAWSDDHQLRRAALASGLSWTSVPLAATWLDAQTNITRLALTPTGSIFELTGPDTPPRTWLVGPRP